MLGRFLLTLALSISCAGAQADLYARIDADGRGWDQDTPYAKMVRAAAQAAKVQPELIHAVIHVESNYQPAARSPAGAVGLMQLMPATAKRYNVKNRLDPQQNILGGARYLRDLLDLFEDNLSLTLAAYNAGENAVLKHGKRIPPYGETVAYVPKVMALYKKLTGASGADAALRDTLPQTRVSRVDRKSVV